MSHAKFVAMSHAKFLASRPANKEAIAEALAEVESIIHVAAEGISHQAVYKPDGEDHDDDEISYAVEIAADLMDLIKSQIFDR